MQQLPILAKADRRRDPIDALHVGTTDLLPRDRYEARRRAELNVPAGNATMDRRDRDTCHPLGVTHGVRDGPRRLFDIADEATTHPGFTRHPNTQDLDAGVPLVSRHLADHGAGLRAAEVDPGYESLFLHAALRTTTMPVFCASSCE